VACCDAAPAPCAAPAPAPAPCAAPAPAPCAAPASSCCDADPCAKPARPKLLSGLMAKHKSRRASCSAPAASSCCDAAPAPMAVAAPVAAPACGCN
jgi:hypothetical protein